MLLLLLLLQTADDDAPVDYVVPGSVPITGTYSKTEAEYLAATGAAGRGLDTVSEHKSGTSGGVVEERPSGGVVEERPVQVGVAEVGLEAAELAWQKSCICWPTVSTVLGRIV